MLVVRLVYPVVSCVSPFKKRDLNSFEWFGKSFDGTW